MPLYLRIQWGWPPGGGQLEVAAVFSDIVFLNCFVYGIPWESPGDGGMLARWPLHYCFRSPVLPQSTHLLRCVFSF